MLTVKKKKKAFTIVELVIVIAVVAVLAAVLIPTFSNIIENAREAAYLQERNNQKREDLIQEATNPGYLSWDDFEAVLAEILINYDGDLTESEAKNYFADYNQTSLTEDQIRAIIERTHKGTLTTAMVAPIVTAVLANQPDPVAQDADAPSYESIVEAAIATLGKEIGFTAEEMIAAINGAFTSNAVAVVDGKVAEVVNEIIDTVLSDRAIESILKVVLTQLGQGGVGVSIHVTKIELNKDTVELVVGGQNSNVYLYVSFTPNGASNKDVKWTSSNEEVAKVERVDGIGVALVTAVGDGEATITARTVDGNKTATCKVIVSACDHSFDYTIITDDEGQYTTCSLCGEDEECNKEKHTKTCSLCDKTVIEHHHYTEGVCECDRQKAYTYKCDNSNCSSEVTGTKLELTAQGYYDCTKIGHEDQGHYKCKRCTSCLIKVETCNKNHKRDKKSLDAREHRITCYVCDETFDEDHVTYSASNTQCMICGYCPHKDGDGHNTMLTAYAFNKEDDNYDSKHYKECSLCHDKVAYDHVKEWKDNEDGTHTYCCAGECGWEGATESHDLSIACGKCDYEPCTHEEAYEYKDAGQNYKDRTHHYKVCQTCGASFAAEEHSINATTGNCTANCGVQVVTKQTHLNYTSLGDGKVIYIDMEGFNLSKALSLSAGNAVIDLCDHEITVSRALTVSGVGTSLTLRNGTMNFTSYISLSSSSSNPTTHLILDDVIINFSGTGVGMIQGKKNTAVTIKNSKIDVSGSTNKRAIFYTETNAITNANVTIENTNFILGDGGNVVYYNKAGANSNIIAVEGIKVDDAFVNDVTPYIHGTYGTDYSFPTDN